MAGGEIASAYLSIYPKLEGKSVVDEITRGMSGAGDKAGAELADSMQRSVQSGMDGAGKTGGESFASGFGTTAKVALGSIIAQLATTAANEFKNRFSDGIEQSDAMQKFASTMKFAGFDTKQIEEVRKAMKDYADQTVYDLGEVMDTTAKLAANGVTDFDSLVQAAGNLNAAAGGSSESFGYFANAITQVNGAGKLMSQDWNQIVNALPGASGAIQNELKEMGAWDDSMGTFKDALANGQVSAEQFNEALKNLGMTDAAQEAATSTTTFEGAMGQLDASVTNTMQGIYDSLNEDGRITDAINGMAGAFESLSPYVSTLADAFGDFVEFVAPALPIIAGIAAGIAAVSGISAIIGAIAGAVTFLTTVVGPALAMVGSVPGLVALVMSVLGGPITIIGAIIGAIVAFIATNEDAREAVLKVWEGLKKGITDTVSNLSKAIPAKWNEIKTKTQATWNNIKTFITNAWTAIKGTVLNAANNVFNTVRNAFNNVKTAISSAMSSATTVISNAFNNAKNAVSGAVSSIRTAVSNGFNAVVGFVAGIPSRILGAIGNLGNLLWSAGSSLMSGLKNGIVNGFQRVKDYVSGIAGTIKSLKGPLDYDKKVLIENGEALMAGLQKGLQVGFDDDVKPYVTSMAGAISNALDTGASGHTYYPSAAGASYANTSRGGVVVTGNTFVVRNDADIAAIGRAINTQAARQRRAAL